MKRHFLNTVFGIIEILITVFIILLIAILTRKILKKIPSKILFIVILIASSILFVSWVKIIKLHPEADQKMIHDMAISIIDGKISSHLIPGQYLFLYPYQLGLSFFVALIYKIFGIDFMNVLFINCFCSIINIIIIFNISKILFKNENIQKILVILLGCFSLYWMFFNVHFYGNILGFTFALLAMLFTLFYLEKNKLINLIFSGIFIAIAILLKSNYQIFLCGIILILILDIIKRWEIKNLLIIPVFIAGYLIVNLGYSALVKCNNLDLPDGVPMISFVYMGMDETSTIYPGWYNGVTVDLYTENNFDNEKTIENTKKLIKERINYFYENPKEFFIYYGQKIGSTWLNPTFQTIWCSLPGARYHWYGEYNEYLSNRPTLRSMFDGDLYIFEENFFNIYQIIIFIFASIGIFKNAKNINLKTTFLIIIFAGGFIFHIIWETKAIYVIQYYFILLPFAAYGLDYFIDKSICFFREKIFNKSNLKQKS